mmetsp:Transcript_8752/g.15151  ORF Transcript_8752/g.15151 Transcript_8752/m.15151 type:complete len:84 (+) Transcript_8752:545-796(+)
MHHCINCSSELAVKSQAPSQSHTCAVLEPSQSARRHVAKAQLVHQELKLILSGQTWQITRPLTSAKGTGPYVRESKECNKLSP